MKFNAILVLWGLLVGYVAYHEGALDKVATYVNSPFASTKAAPEAKPGKSAPAYSDPSKWTPRKVTQQDRGNDMQAYRASNWQANGKTSPSD